jgi:hypothetical protein
VLQTRFGQRAGFERTLSKRAGLNVELGLISWAVCTFPCFDFLEWKVLSTRRTRDAVFLGGFSRSISKSGKYVAGTFLSKCPNRTLLGSNVRFSRKKRMAGVLALSSVDFVRDGVGLCMVVFPTRPIKKGPAYRSFVERKKGLQAPSDTWSFRLVLVPGSLGFLDPEVFQASGVWGFMFLVRVHYIG